jgi:hypothetical protein
MTLQTSLSELEITINETKRAIINKTIEKKALKLAPFEQQYNALRQQRDIIAYDIEKVNRVCMCSILKIYDAIDVIFYY